MDEKTGNLAIKAGAVVGGYFFIIKPLLAKFGLVKSEEDTKNLAEENSNAWNPNYWKTAKPPKLGLNSEGAKALARAIGNSFGTLNDNENKITIQFKLLKTQVQNSQLVDTYRQLYNEDLFRTLYSKLSDKEFNSIINFVKNLPPRVANK